LLGYPDAGHGARLATAAELLDHLDRSGRDDGARNLAALRRTR
jgi:hypothetical protein